MDIKFLLKPRYSKTRALIIGINTYKNISILHHAVNDATAFRSILINNFSVKEENISFLTNEEATKINIYNAFMRFTRDDIDIDERIFIFFAGHGTTTSGYRGEVGYLAPYDAILDDFSTFFRWDDFTKNSELVPAKHLLFILDACFSGLMLTRSATNGTSRFLKDMLHRLSRQVITAGKANETVADSGGPIPGHSIFTGHLIQALTGKAINDDGILTANSLMAYLYKNVANDKNSNQTPHYGYFDGDGDLIFSAPQLDELENSKETYVDQIIITAATEEDLSINKSLNKIKKIKELLSRDSAVIELHDFLVNETQIYLSETHDDFFRTQDSFSEEKFLERILRYNDASYDLSLLLACIAYWGKSQHHQILQKIFARMTDRLNMTSGLSTWINLRWYPLVVCFYSAGIAAVEAKRYDALQCIFSILIQVDRSEQYKLFADEIASAIQYLGGGNNTLFSIIPDHKSNYFPLSEYLYKTLQSKLEDVFFLGKNYEIAFDEFEILFGLTAMHLKEKSGKSVWPPPGRYRWKKRSHEHHPLLQVVKQAEISGNNWTPFTAGLFDSSWDQFKKIVDMQGKIQDSYF